MMLFNSTNLKNIRSIFEEKTGTKLDTRHDYRPIKITATAFIAVVFMLSITMTAFAGSRFSSLEGDQLGFSSDYDGNGIVRIHVENKSKKELEFQPKLKLMLWSTGEEIQPVSGGKVSFSGTLIQANSSGTMTVDLSAAYDIAFLEQPLVNDHYYFILTNNDFMFGQDWMCSVSFAEAAVTETEEAEPLAPAGIDNDLPGQIFDTLRPYFESYVSDPYERNQKVAEYFAQCEKLLAEVDGDIIAPTSSPLVIDGLNPEVVFDEAVPLENQHWLSGLHTTRLDGYNIPVGATWDDYALMIEAYIAQYEGELIGGASVPLLYFFTYNVSDITSEQDMAFVRGHLLTFEQMEQHKVYEDENYVCYDLTDYFYSDLRAHVESIVSQRTDIYLDERMWTRIQNIYNYYRDKDVLAERFFYLDLDIEQ